MKPNFKCERSINYDLLYDQLVSLRERIKNTPRDTDEQIESLTSLYDKEKDLIHKMVQLINDEINEVKSSTILLQPHKVEDITILLHNHLIEIKALEECKLDLLNSILEVSSFLGSCQYKSIEDYYFMCKSLYEQIELFNNPSNRENNLQCLFQLLGFSTLVTYDTEEEYLTHLCNIIDEYLEDYGPNEDNPVVPPVTIKSFHDFFRKEASDLWSVAEPPFNILDNPLLPNTYYDLEQISLTILCCQVLYGTDITVFADFDT